VPPLDRLESIPDPKAVLEGLLVEAAGSPTGRRLRRFRRDLTSRRVNVAAYVQDYSVLKALESYAAFIDDLRRAYTYSEVVDA
jgi:hypothetical protein